MQPPRYNPPASVALDPGRDRMPTSCPRSRHYRPAVETLEARDLLAAASAANVFLGQVYDDLFQRSVDPAGLAVWTVRLAAGESRAQVVGAILASEEYRRLEVPQLYAELLARAADAGSLDYHVQALGKTETLADLRAAMLASNEYYQNRAGDTNTMFLTALYHDLLGRNTDAGATAWEVALNKGTPRSRVV